MAIAPQSSQSDRQEPLVVRTVDLTKIYKSGGMNSVTVLNGVQLEVQLREFVAVIGQSGSGKSTLLNILGALDRPTSGEVWINDVNSSSLSPMKLSDLRSTAIGFIFQFHFLLDEFNVLENALMPIKIKKGRPSSADVSHARQLLERVGLSDHLHKHPNQLSGGQQQRTAIVRALVNRPALILADEPTGNLDSQSGHEVFSLMREMNHETGVAVVMITHDQRLASAADRILTLEDGVLTETPAESRSQFGHY